MNNNEFISELSKLDIKVTTDQLKKLEDYYNLLTDWNNKMNLTAITDKKEVYLKHFYDSLTIVNNSYINFNDNLNVCDIGTGAGFPGIVLKILFSSLSITLVDSLNKRVTFLNEVIKKLDLKNICAVHDRAENFALNHKEEFDIVTSRAVANLRILLEYSIPILKINGYFVPLKGKIDEEIIESKNALSSLNSKLIEVNSFNLPIEKSIRNILVIKKIGKTNKKYPRKFDKIKKNPL